MFLLTENCLWLIRRSHELRYTLKNKATDEVYFVVVFTLLLREDIEKEEAGESAAGGKTLETDAATREKSTDELKEDELD